jgi:hypothetical protein
MLARDQHSIWLIMNIPELWPQYFDDIRPYLFGLQIFLNFNLNCVVQKCIVDALH